MPRYPEERRQAVVAKLLPPHNLTAQEVAEQEGISVATIYKWRKEVRTEGRCLPDAGEDKAAWQIATPCIRPHAAETLLDGAARPAIGLSSRWYRSIPSESQS